MTLCRKQASLKIFLQEQQSIITVLSFIVIINDGDDPVYKKRKSLQGDHAVLLQRVVINNKTWAQQTHQEKSQGSVHQLHNVCSTRTN